MATCPHCGKHYPDDNVACDADGLALLPDEICAQIDLPEGRAVGDHIIAEKIGEGTYGKVYRGLHRDTGEAVAIKVLNHQYVSKSSTVSRFVSEARAVGGMRHPNIVRILAFGQLESGQPYHVMELLEGPNLSQYLAVHQKMPPELALPVFRQIASALDAIHGADIIHRDLKPDNIHLTFDASGWCTPVLLDFGIAKLVGAAVAHRTKTGTLMGTPRYMSPEQCRGEKVDRRSDVYAFGCLLHKALTGQSPFVGESMGDLLLLHARSKPPPMSTVNPALPPALDAPVLEALAKAREDRPEAASTVMREMEAAARSAGLKLPTPPSTGRPAWQLWAALVAALAVAGGVAWLVAT